MIPEELRSRPQWVVWKAETRNGKPTKVPYRPDAPRVKAETDSPATWGSLEEARAVPDVDGEGYVFSADDPFTGVDLDDCIDQETGEIHPAAANIIQRLGSYTERSPSGTGVHIIVRAELHSDRHATKDTPWGGKFEVYDRGRFFTMTGQTIGSLRLTERSAALDEVVREFLPPKVKARPKTNGRVELSLSDSELLEKMFAAKNGAKVRDLYHSSGSEDPSADDQALCNHLAFWAGPHPDRIDALFRGSARMRPKWDERHRGDGATYGAMTIETALAGRTEFYGDRQTSTARTSAGTADDAADRISWRWGITSDPIVSGSSLGDIASGDAIIYLHQRSGRRLRFPSLSDLFEPRKHTRIVSLATRARFQPLSPADTTEIAQLIVQLCGGEDRDPLEEASMWVGEFIASAADTIDGEGKSNWELLAEHKQAEKDRDVADRMDRRPVLIRRDGRLWLPSGDLKNSTGTRISWWEFDNRLLEIGWPKIEVYVREPASRGEREAGSKAGRIHRSFYRGED